MKLWLLVRDAFRRWWKQILILLAVLLLLVLTDRLTIWFALVFSIVAGVWLAILDRRR